MIARVSCILTLILTLVLQAQAADNGVDHQYEAMVNEALANPESVNYMEMRALYAKSRYYKRYDSDPENFRAAALLGKTVPDDDVRRALKEDFALPGVHLYALGHHFKDALSKEEISLNTKVFVKLVEAIVKTGSGVTKDQATKVLVVSEEYLLIRALQAKNLNQRLVTDRDRRFDVQRVQLKNGKQLDLWFEVTDLFKK